MTIKQLLESLELSHIIPKDFRENEKEIIQVELPNGSYRNIKEIFWLSDRTVIRLQEIPKI